MVKRIGTTQRKTRHKFQRHYRERGKTPLSKYFQELNTGDKVNLKINSSVQKGMFYSKFHGLTGVVTGKKGSCYEVKVYDRNKEKTLFVHPIHLKKQ
ncbi:MAG: 50S ribosomal protein L21e [Nanoarchaeota archaeon]